MQVNFLKILNFTNAVEKVEADSSTRTDSKSTIGYDNDTEPYFIKDNSSGSDNDQVF